MRKELLEYFDFNVETPSVLAYTQQRSKVLTKPFEYLFRSFTDDNLPSKNNYHGSIVNKLHLNAFYDVLNRIYTDVIVQTATECNEFRACATMIERSNLENVILVADRGYEKL